MSLQILSTILAQYFNWHRSYKKDSSNTFVCLVTELIGNSKQHALCETAKAHIEIMSVIEFWDKPFYSC
jgi:hypothetical protein